MKARGDYSKDPTAPASGGWKVALVAALGIGAAFFMPKLGPRFASRKR